MPDRDVVSCGRLSADMASQCRGMVIEMWIWARLTILNAELTLFQSCRISSKSARCVVIVVVVDWDGKRGGLP